MTNEEIQALQDKIDERLKWYDRPGYTEAFLSGRTKGLLEFRWYLETLKKDIPPKEALAAQLMVLMMDERSKIPCRPLTEGSPGS